MHADPPPLAFRGGRGAILAGVLLTALAIGEAAGRPGRLFMEGTAGAPQLVRA